MRIERTAMTDVLSNPATVTVSEFIWLESVCYNNMCVNWVCSSMACPPLLRDKRSAGEAQAGRAVPTFVGIG